jgi:3-phosphoshikimate 1-carboxyvinyltransferase
MKPDPARPNSARLDSTRQIQPSTLSGAVAVPPSKSLLHRGLFCAAMAGDLSLCELPAVLSVDIRATLDCCKKWLAGESDFFCGESGTTLRLLVPIAAARFDRARFTGAGRLSQRPLAEYRDTLGSRGTTCKFPADAKSFLPLETVGRLKPGVFRVPGNVSSQYISGLLLALPLLNGDSDIVVTTELESAAYVEMTRDVVHRFGVKTSGTREDNRFCLSVPRQPNKPGRGSPYHIAKPYGVEPDFSQAAFWQLARFLGHDVTVEGLPEYSSQGDAFFATLLHILPGTKRELGAGAANANPQYGTWRARIHASRGATGSRVDVSQIPDLVPPLAAAASFADGETLLFNAARLRAKESDRVASTCKMLRAFGVDVSSNKSSITIQGKPGRTCNACAVDCQRDHRIVMAAAMLATRAAGTVTLRGADAVAKSYPTFFEDYKKLGGVCS